MFRYLFGFETYGTPLQTFNGRDALQDAMEEALDACQYLYQHMRENGKHWSLPLQTAIQLALLIISETCIRGCRDANQS
jgi:hypothetical protein